MPTVSYPYDSTGRQAANLVRNEPQVLTVVNNDAYRFLIPNFAPFYKNNFRLVGKDAMGNAINLVEGRDYQFSMKYIVASRANGTMLYGGIAIINQNIQNTVTVTYQCLGGQYSADRDRVVQAIAENNYNPRRIAWDQVTSIQEVFPPSPHPQDLDTFTGFADLIAAVDRLTTTVATENPLKNSFYAHVLDTNDPHKTLNHLPNDIATERYVNQKIAERNAEFTSVPTEYKYPLITVTQPHRRYMVWDPTNGIYVRAPWHQPGILQYAYHNQSVYGSLPVRADASYRQIDYPDLIKKLGLSGTGNFSLIEVRGEFIRCMDNGRGVDVARGWGSAQQDGIGPHNHFLPTSTGTAGNTWNLVDYSDPRSSWFKSLANQQPVTGENATTFPLKENVELGVNPLTYVGDMGKHAHETRPRNVAFTAWVTF